MIPRADINDTICAIATPVGDGGIGIVRISGKEALKIADKVFVSKGAKAPSEFKTFTTHYGWIKSDSKVIDEVILTVMRSPRSFTKEDVVEINCHGGIVALRAVLDLVLACGCRLAEPGEFTKRAFLNGRIDLTQAEAVLDVIHAKTDAALKIGVEQLKGNLSKEINKCRETLLDILTVIEANIDFPEEEISAADLDNIKKQLERISADFKGLLERSRAGKVLREGIHAVICGKPNVGKSSLLNALLKSERSIVTPVAGTTRDTIEEIIDIKGIPVRIVDTAGILKARGLIEKKAVERSREQIRLADLIIILFDGSRKLSREDELLMRRLKGRTAIALINKMDLKQSVEKQRIARIFGCVIGISAKKMKNINLLEDAIAGLVYKGCLQREEPLMISNLRHIECLRRAEKLIAEAHDSLDNRLSLEFIAQGLKDAILHLDDILGKRFSEELLDKIFNEFCIGK